MGNYCDVDGRSYFDIIESYLLDWREHAPFSFPTEDLRGSHSSSSFLSCAKPWLDRLVLAMEADRRGRIADVLERKFAGLMGIADKMDELCSRNLLSRDGADPLAYDEAVEAAGDSCGDAFDELIACLRQSRDSLTVTDATESATTVDALRPYSPSESPIDTEIPAKYRDGGKPDGEPLTVEYVSLSHTYNLSGSYLSKQRPELEVIKIGRKNVYLFADIAKLSAAKNLSENQGH